jgi:hypothetical protein
LIFIVSGSVEKIKIDLRVEGRMNRFCPVGFHRARVSAMLGEGLVFFDPSRFRSVIPMNFPYASGLTCLLFSSMLLGCGGTDVNRPTTHPVSGVVTHKGAPVANAVVTFNPEAADSPPAVGRTDEQGRYQLMTFEPGDGAIAGKYVVTITKYEGAAPTTGGEVSEEEYVPPEAAGRQEGPKNLLPAKYAAMHTSGLSA